MQLQWKKEWTAPSVISVVSFGIGVGVGYGIRAYLNSRLVRSFDDIMNEHNAEMKEEQLRLDLNGHDPEVIELIEVVEEEEEEEWNPTDLLISRSAHPSQSVFPPIIEDDWDYTEEMKNRNPEDPYIIHVDEYNDNTGEYSQSTLTYYKGDDVLTDELDMPIYNAEKVASPLTFGKGSQDPSIVYIRNERLEAEYEVLLDHGYFQVEVLGEEIETKYNSKKSPLHKFKEE